MPVRNARSIVTQQLDALLGEAVAAGLEVIVVDDASRDGTARVVEEWIRARDAGSFRLIRRTRRGGPNASRNDGVAAARADVLLFCDGDDVVVPGWASAMLGAWADDAILCGGIVDLVPTDPPRVWDLPPMWWGVPYAYGGNMGVSRSVVQRLGGFDEAIVAGGTEFELSYRAQGELGMQVVAVPEAVVRYRFATDARSSFARSFRRSRGRLYLQVKLGDGLPPRRRPAAWAREWRDVARQVVGPAADPASRRVAAATAGGILGRLWWGGWFRVREPLR